MCCTTNSKSSTETESQRSELRDERKQAACWNAAPASAVNPVLVLMLNAHCTRSFAFKAVPVLKIQPHLFNLATACDGEDTTYR